MSERQRRRARAALPLFLLFGVVSLSFAETATETVTLDQALQAALQGGLDAKIAGLTLEAARAQYDQAAAQLSSIFWPV